jgi:hypothetical protein
VCIIFGCWPGMAWNCWPWGAGSRRFWDELYAVWERGSFIVPESLDLKPPGWVTSLMLALELEFCILVFSWFRRFCFWSWDDECVPLRLMDGRCKLSPRLGGFFEFTLIESLSSLTMLHLSLLFKSLAEPFPEFFPESFTEFLSPFV